MGCSSISNVYLFHGTCPAERRVPSCPSPTHSPVPALCSTVPLGQDPANQGGGGNVTEGGRAAAAGAGLLLERHLPVDGLEVEKGFNPKCTQDFPLRFIVPGVPLSPIALFLAEVVAGSVGQS